MGIPTIPQGTDNETLIVQRHFVINYDADLNTPTWAAYRLTADDVDENRPGYVRRLDCFRNYPSDIHPDTTPPLCDDYENDSFDRGHIVNSNDMRRSRTSNANTFYLTNMAPQFSNFNRKIWRTLEGRVNNWAETKGEIYIITGAVFDHNSDGQRDIDANTQRNDGDARISVASNFYKIIFHQQPNGFIETISIMLPHNNQSITGDGRWPYLTRHIVSIRDIEQLTGINFLPELEIQNPVKANAVRNARASGLWPAN